LLCIISEQNYNVFFITLSTNRNTKLFKQNTSLTIKFIQRKDIQCKLLNYLKIFFREEDIFYNKKLDSLIRQREVLHMIARQLAFLWTYDSPLWSKKGFAVFFAAYMLDEVLDIFELDILMFYI